MTATFKQKKQDLVRANYDPSASADLIYVKDKERQRFVKLDAALVERIRSGALRL